MMSECNLNFEEIAPLLGIFEKLFEMSCIRAGGTMISFFFSFCSSKIAGDVVLGFLPDVNTFTVLDVTGKPEVVAIS